MTLSTALAGVGLVVLFVGSVSIQQARYLDGDHNAHTHRAPSGLFHEPVHPWAIRAKRRGLVLSGVGLVLLLVGLFGAYGQALSD